MKESGLTPTHAILDSRKQRFEARLAKAGSSKLKEMHEDPSSSTLICRVVEIEQKHGLTTEAMSWLATGEEPPVKTTILEHKSISKSAA